jgi:hypothetical protein
MEVECLCKASTGPSIANLALKVRAFINYLVAAHAGVS